MTKPAYKTQAWRRLREQAIMVYGDRCWKCKRIIDLTIKRGRWAYSLHHLDPVKHYGDEVPDISRVRPTHVFCNSQLGDKVKRPQSRVW